MISTLMSRPKLFELSMANNSRTQRTRLKKGEIWKENDLVCIVLDEFVEIEISDLVEISEVSEEFWKDKKLKVLTDLRGLSDMSKEARKFSSEKSFELKEFIVASAAVVDGGVSRLIGNWILKIDRRPYPFKLFNSREKALSWLDSQ